MKYETGQYFIGDGGEYYSYITTDTENTIVCLLVKPIDNCWYPMEVVGIQSVEVDNITPVNESLDWMTNISVSW